MYRSMPDFRRLQSEKNTDLGGQLSWIKVHEVTNTANLATLSWTDPESMSETNEAYSVEVTGIERAYNGP